MPSFIEQVMRGSDWQQERTLTDQKIQQGQISLDQQKQLMEMMKQRKIQQGETLADQIDFLAGVAADTGNTAAATKLATKGSTIRKNIAQAGKAEADTDYANAGVTQREADVKLKEAQRRLADARAAHLNKDGAAKTVAADRVLAEKSIRNDYPGITDEQAYIQSVNITERAKELMRSNPALDKPTAIARAYRELEKTDIFAPYRHARPLAGTSANPIPVPSDAKTLVKGRLYVNEFGQIGKWTGRGFELVEPEEDEEKEDSDE